ITPPAAVVVPPAVEPAQPAPVPPAETQPAAPATESVPPQATAQSPAVTSPAAVSPAAAVQSADRPATETPQPGASRASNPNAAVRVELTAEEPVWVLARAGGKYLFSGTLEPKQTRSVESNGPLLLRLGNAGGVN